ncbi:hypothetical protein QFZ22_003398 [Streptomyces canus]|uniref:Uncharacterized protein n=1 Tax=Streptomyces canus TaxID=58343 RepID=A0AAW8FCU2_9ACTN|nr:hypothetical protein [Streptomyces canus]MDQ0907413.1 hypothetical protein [Streptomyces canus]
MGRSKQLMDYGNPVNSRTRGAIQPDAGVSASATRSINSAAGSGSPRPVALKDAHAPAGRASRSPMSLSSASRPGSVRDSTRA